MDSKYASIGGANEIKNNFKRNKPVLNINTKKIKLSNEGSSLLTAVANGQGVNSSCGKNILKESKDNLQDARRQLPVNMVRGR